MSATLILCEGFMNIKLQVLLPIVTFLIGIGASYGMVYTKVDSLILSAKEDQARIAKLEQNYAEIKTDLEWIKLRMQENK